MAEKSIFSRMKSAAEAFVNVSPQNPSSQESTNLFQKMRELEGGWHNKFVRDIYNEGLMDPHEEMAVARKLLLYNAWAQAGVRTLADFLYGGSVSVSSENAATERFLNQYIEDSGLRKYTPQLFEDLVTFGISYVEPVAIDRKSKRYRGEQVIHYVPQPNPERIYHDLDKNGDVVGYVIELPEGQWSTAAQYTVRYYGDRLRAIRGVRFEKNALEMCSIGQGTIPTYGRGYLATVANDAKVLLELERAMAVIARYKAIPKKLISTAEQEGPGDAQDTQKLINYLNNVADDENPVTNLPVDAVDLSYAGKETNFGPMVDYLKRKITVALAPEFIIHGEDVNRSTSKEQREGFLLRAKSIRETPKRFLERLLKRALRPYPDLNAPFEVEFGDFDVGEETETREWAVKMYQSGLLTLNEARDMIGLEPDEEVGDGYAWELQPQGGPDDQTLDPFGGFGEAQGEGPS